MLRTLVTKTILALTVAATPVSAHGAERFHLTRDHQIRACTTVDVPAKAIARVHAWIDGQPLNSVQQSLTHVLDFAIRGTLVEARFHLKSGPLCVTMMTWDRRATVRLVYSWGPSG